MNFSRIKPAYSVRNLLKFHGVRYPIESNNYDFYRLCISRVSRCTYSIAPVNTGSNYNTFYDPQCVVLNQNYRNYCTTPLPNEHETKIPANEGKRPTLFQRFKLMYKQYWYVLVPVHILTSTIWFVSFYQIAKSGVDLVWIFESVGASENMIEKVKSGHSTAGYIAISYAMYKLATPLRYTVTLGGTTISIKYLKEWGLIKPIPPKEKLKELYEEQKSILKENFITKILNKFRSKGKD